VFRALTLLVFATAVALAACGDDDSDSGAADRPDRTERSAAGGGDVACATDVEQPAPRRDGGARKPKGELNPAKTYEVSLETSCGEITIRVDQRISPKTAASFVSLAESEFYDDTIFHRIVPDFVIQGGDPTGTGTGGPGRGLAVVQAIGALGDPASGEAGTPLETVVIEGTRVRES
jgi:Cyclophilin type peptidyl-prolyl cis-trans isomerase/CLD